MLFRWSLSLALLPPIILALAACKDGDKEPEATPTPEVRIVTSDDGMLSLAIPDGAVDEDTEITITAVPREELPEELANLQGGGAGYTLEPDGLEFDEAVTATLELPVAELEDWPEGGADAYGLVSFNETDGREILQEAVTTYVSGEDTMTVSGPLTHFSFLTRTKGSLRASLEEVGDLPVGAAAAFEYSIRNNARMADGVTLKAASANFIASGAVTLIGDKDTAPVDLAAGTSDSGDRDVKCDDSPGRGVYTMQASASSVVSGGDPSGTKLRVVLDSLVNCVEEEGSPTPDDTIAIKLPNNLRDYLDAWGFKSTSQLAAVQFTTDPTNDHIYGDPNQTAGFTPGYTDFNGVFRVAVTLTQEAAQTLTEAYPCGSETNGVITACSGDATEFPAGEAFVVGGTFVEPLPETTDRTCIFAAVFNGGNPFQAQTPFLWDFYQETSHWYEVGSAAGGAWSLFPSSVGEGNSPRNLFPSNARFFIVPELQTIGGIIPRSEITAATAYRATADCHNDSFDPAQSGGDVPGANPTEPLTPLPDTWITLDNLCGGRCLPRDPSDPIALF